MSKLNKDILSLIFEELQYDQKSLFSCLMINKIWSETAIPILWKNPWKYATTYNYKNGLYYIITFYLPNDIKEFLTKQRIQLPSILHQSLLFDYLSLCRSINMEVINGIVAIGSSSSYNLFLLQQEVYNVFIRKCPELKYLNMISIRHQIFYFPGAKSCLSSICELTIDKSTDPSYFFGIACICNNIQKLIINNTDAKPNNGIAKLIEVQKNLKYFEWNDEPEDYFVDEDYLGDGPYSKTFLALIEKANTLNHLIINFQYVDYFYYGFLQTLLPKLYKLKILEIIPCSLNGYKFQEQSKLLSYRDLEVFKTDYAKFSAITRVISNSGGQIKEISIPDYGYDPYSVDYNESLIFIRAIYEKCPLIERLSLEFPPTKNHFIEFGKLLENCQNLKILLLNVTDYLYIKNMKAQFVNGEELLKTIAKSAPINLREIRLLDDVKFSVRALEKFFEGWGSERRKLSIFSIDPIYEENNNYVNVITKYKNDGVIKDFIRVRTVTEIYE